jgi:ribokinase
MMKGHIVVVGSLNMDLVVRTPRLPKPGETIIGSEFRTFPGGKGANQAVAAARLGAQVKMIGCVGNDAFGEALIETVARDGVETTFIRKDLQAATGVAFISVETSGQNSIVVASGANALLTPEDVSAAQEAFDGASVLLLQLESPLHAVTRAIELAHRHGAQVVLNPAPAQLLEVDFLNRVDYIIPNQTELALLTGMESISEGVNALKTWGIRRVIVTLGEEGVLVAENENQVHLPADLVTVVDTTAAGDAFVGAFAVALNEGHPTLTAAAWGKAAGALAVTRAGAQPSLPTRSEFEKFMSERTGETDA